MVALFQNIYWFPLYCVLNRIISYVWGKPVTCLYRDFCETLKTNLVKPLQKKKNLPNTADIYITCCYFPKGCCGAPKAVFYQGTSAANFIIITGGVKREKFRFACGGWTLTIADSLRRFSDAETLKLNCGENA